MLAAATESLIAVARDPAATDADMDAAAKSFVQAASRASRDEAGAAIRTISKHFDRKETPRAGFLALLCGAMVERGCDPLAMAQSLTEELGGLLKASASLASACVATMPALGGDDEAQNEEEDPSEVFETKRRELAATMPEENAAWEALRQFWPPAIAVYSLSPEARAAARPLRDAAASIDDWHEAGHWLRLMLSVLDNEPILAIEPPTMLGVEGRISGVVDNFQLNVLLMDAFPKAGLLARRRVPQRVAEVARGAGPQQSDDIVTGVWNLYTWQAIQPGGGLPDPGDYSANQFWIWNEGTPEDIPVFDGRRVILLGPASYPRSWQSQRMFDKLPAGLEIERKLGKSEVRDWLDRLAAAKSVS